MHSQCCAPITVVSFQNSSITPRIIPVPPDTPIPWQRPICSLPLWVCLFSTFQVTGRVEYRGPSRLASFPRHRVFKVYPCRSKWSSSPFAAAQYPTVCVDGPRFIGLSVDGHFGCFYFLAVTTNATVFTCKFLRGHPFLFLLGIYT